MDCPLNCVFGRNSKNFQKDTFLCDRLSLVVIVTGRVGGGCFLQHGECLFGRSRITSSCKLGNQKYSVVLNFLRVIKIFGIDRDCCVVDTPGVGLSM